MKTAIIGRGNVATHLCKAFAGKSEVIQINPHTLEGIPEDAELILICVSDDAIPDIASNLPETKAIVAHTSGSVPLSALDGKGSSQGVLYPLQTFTKDVELDYNEIPFFIEGSSQETEDFLEKTASLISKNIRKADSEERRKLHLSSVFVCNFVNAMATIGTEILSDTSISRDVLTPLMRQTIRKLETMEPRAAQTGPASRGDRKTIERHVQMLAGNPELQQLYSVITRYISNRNLHK